MPALPFRRTLAAGLHVAAALVLLAALPGPLAAQAVLAVSPHQCVWRAGDDPSWAAPSLDESGWQPYTQWKQPDQPRYWVRCHVRLGELSSAAHPAIQVTLYAAYQLYLDGALIGQTGNLRTGNYSMNSVRSFPAPAASLSAEPATVAVRIIYRYADPRAAATDRSLPVFQTGSSVAIEAGDSAVLQGLRANEILAQLHDPLIGFACYCAIGALALVLLAQYFQDRSRRDLLILSLSALATAAIHLRLFSVAALWNLPVWANVGWYATGAIVNNCAQPLFFFSAARRPVPLLFWILIVLAPMRWLLQDFGLLLSASHSLALGTMASSNSWLGTVCYCAIAAAGVAPFVAFWPYRSISRRMMPLAAICMAWGATLANYFAADALVINSAALAHRFPAAQAALLAWHLAASHASTVVSIFVLIALMGLLSRDQRRTTEERAALAGEMRAARVVQQVLIPEVVPSVPGFAIKSVYKPAGEVGGDFFQIISPSTGGVLIVIGDVSGKGMPAAMTVSLLVGTVRTLAHYVQSPSEILSAMNQRMLARSQGGFTTCIALRVDSDGAASAANAGHLAPYLAGKELEIENGLPLGLDPHAVYQECAFRLPPDAQLTFVTDGVVEARSTSGELFGFERTAAISTEAAESIARAAQAYGQEDDITVLTLTRLSGAAEVLSTAQPAALPDFA